MAFTNVRRGMPGMAYFAGVSLSYSGECMGSSAFAISAACHASTGQERQDAATLPCCRSLPFPFHPCRPAERCELNFGARPFQHPVEGYRPLHLEAPSPADAAEMGLPGGRAGQLAAARYLAGCFSRLTDVSSPSPAAPATPSAAEPAAAEPAEAAAAVAAAASQPASEGSSSHEGGLGEEELEEQPLPGGPLFPAVPAGMGTRPSLGAGLLPDADMLAALAAAGSSKPPARPGSAQGRPSSAGAGAPAIGMDDRVLLGAVLAQHLGPLCCDQYIVEAALLPWLDDTAGDLCSSPGPAVPSRLSFEEHGGSGQQGGSGTGGSGGGGADAEPASPDAPASSPAAATASAAAPKQAAEGLELGRQCLAQLLQLLAAVLEPEELSVLVSTVCWVRCNALAGVLRSLSCFHNLDSAYFGSQQPHNACPLLLPMQSLGRRVRSCVWSLQELPASPALAALRLWGAMLDCEDVRAGAPMDRVGLCGRCKAWHGMAQAAHAHSAAEIGGGPSSATCRSCIQSSATLAAAWLASGDWMQQLEELLAVRQPSEEDLAEVGHEVMNRGWLHAPRHHITRGWVRSPWATAAEDAGCMAVAVHLASCRRKTVTQPLHPCPPALQLLCNLKVAWGQDGNVVRSGREEQCAFAADLNKLTDGLEQVGVGQQFVAWHQVVSWGGRPSLLYDAAGADSRGV